MLLWHGQLLEGLVARSPPCATPPALTSLPAALSPTYQVKVLAFQTDLAARDAAPLAKKATSVRYRFVVPQVSGVQGCCLQGSGHIRVPFTGQAHETGKAGTCCLLGVYIESARALLGAWCCPGCCWRSLRWDGMLP